MTDAPRVAEKHRKTKETDITVRIDLDGTGKADVQTGIGFLDHMLEGFAKHSYCDLMVRAEGDLHIDGHHTTEDVGIVMGLAAAEALQGGAGITRFGHAYVPMDETLTRASIDLSFRPYLIWKVDFSRDKIGDFDTELFKEWFHAFATNAGACLHVENLYGTNNHHIAESCFKALARAFKMAATREPRAAGAVPSTKGSLGS